MATIGRTRRHGPAVPLPIVGGAAAFLVFGLILAAVTGQWAFLWLATLGAALGWSVEAMASIAVDDAADATGRDDHAAHE
ncbi:MAG TPA: hypothetical protein VFW96_09500 [Thermomicrobiales bacterium]|nr:hypothetical protein [Thermomicrobiales bacterium]